MGRYYRGDIQGKFWFAIQSSDDAEFFGGERYEPEFISYSFSDEDLGTIKNGLKLCDKALGKYEKDLDKFFKEHTGYNERKIAEALEISETMAHKLLEWYARKELGLKILKSVEENGRCDFEAEL